MQYLSQRDLRWCNEKLGASQLTLGRYGCTTTCMSMISDYFKGYVSPIILAHNVHNYTPEGLVLWQNLSFPTMRFVKRYFGRNDGLIQQCLKDPNRAIILNVNGGAHWVVALSKNLFGNSYTVLDPWTGAKCDVLKVYKDIVGAAVFEKI